MSTFTEARHTAPHDADGVPAGGCSGENAAKTPTSSAVHGDDAIPAPSITEQECETLDFLIAHMTSQCVEPYNAAAVCPIVQVLFMAVQAIPGLRRVLKNRLLPRRQDYTQRPERGESLSARLICLMITSNEQVKTVASAFLLALCNESASRLVRRTGYGNAAGFLASRGISQAELGSVEDAGSDTESDEEPDGYNPVTGSTDPSDVQGTCGST